MAMNTKMTNATSGIVLSLCPPSSSLTSPLHQHQHPPCLGTCHQCPPLLPSPSCHSFRSSPTAPEPEALRHLLCSSCISTRVHWVLAHQPCQGVRPQQSSFEVTHQVNHWQSHPQFTLDYYHNNSRLPLVDPHSAALNCGQ